MSVRSSFILILAVTLTFVSGAWARGSGVELGVFGSYLDADDYGDGVGGGVKLELQPADWLAVDARGSYIAFDNPDIDIYPLELALLLNIPLADERIVPYVGVGAGYYFLDADRFDLDDEFGYFPLVGLEIGAYNLSFLIEARWLFLESDVDRLVGEDELTLDGIGINAGLLFRF